MLENLSWNWIEDIFKKIPVPYPILSIFFGCMIFIIYLILMFKDNPGSIFEQPGMIIEALTLSASIAYLLVGNQYIFNEMRMIFHNLKFSQGCEKYTEELYDQLTTKLLNSKRFYLMYFLIVSYFILLDFIRIYVNGTDSTSFCVMAFNVYNYIINFLWLYLLAAILWIIVNIYLMIYRIGSHPFKSALKIDLFSADQAGGLGQLRDFIMKIIIYYSIGFSLIVLSYSPGGISDVYSEIGFLILLLLSGVFLLIAGLRSIQKLYVDRMIEDLDSIIEKYQEQYRRTIEVISDKDGEKKEDDLDFMSKSIEWLHKERAERERILNNNRNTYNLKTGITTLTSILLSFLSIYEKLTNYGIITEILKLLH